MFCYNAFGRILAAAAGIYHISVAFLLVIVVLLIELYITSWGVLRKTMKVIHELHNTDMVEGKAIFGEDKLKSISFASKGEVNISYSAMMKFAGTKNYYAMFTKEYVTLIIDKQQFTPETEMQFLQVVREKMTQILKGKKFKTI